MFSEESFKNCLLGCLAPKTRQKIFPHSCAPCSPPHTPPKGNVILIVTVSQVLKFINRINLNVASFTQANIFFLMIKAQFLKTTCLFTWLPGLSRQTAPSLCHAGSSLQHRDSPVAVQAELLCDGGSSASRPWTDPQPPLHRTTRKSPASHLWGVFFFSPRLCWAFTAAHVFSPAGLSGSYSSVAELGLSGLRLLLWGAGPRAPPASRFSDSSVSPPCTRDLFPRMTERCFTVWMPQFAYPLTCG